MPGKLLWPWDFTDENPGVGCRFLLQGIFLTQRSNLGFLHYRQIFFTSYQGGPDTINVSLATIKLLEENSRLAPKELRAGEISAPLLPAPLQPALRARGFQEMRTSQGANLS